MQQPGTELVTSQSQVQCPNHYTTKPCHVALDEMRCVCVCVKVLNEKAKHITGVQQWPYRAVSRALEVIPRTLIQNCGGQAIRTLTALRVYTHHLLNNLCNV